MSEPKQVDSVPYRELGQWVATPENRREVVHMVLEKVMLDLGKRDVFLKPRQEYEPLFRLRRQWAEGLFGTPGRSLPAQNKPNSLSGLYSPRELGAVA